MVVKLVESLDQFKSELAQAGTKLVIVDFYATWCGPCKMLAPKFEGLSNENTNCVFCKVDVDEASDVAEEYDISAMPTVKYFKGGKMIDEVVGASLEKITEKLKMHM